VTDSWSLWVIAMGGFLFAPGGRVLTALLLC